MKVIWTILCERTIVEQDTNQISFFNVIGEVTIPVQPPDESELPYGGLSPRVVDESELAYGGLSPRVVLVVLWERYNPDLPEIGIGRVRLVGPDNDVLLHFRHEVDLQETSGARAIIKMPGLPVRSQGRHLFKIEAKSPDSDWQEMFELPLNVVIQTEDSP